MAIVKIITESNENPEEIEESLIKSFIEKKDQEFLDKRFDDSLMNLLAEDMDRDFKDSYSTLIKDILEILKRDY